MRISLIIVFLLFCIGCSNDSVDEVIAIQPNGVIEVPFDSKPGHVIIVFTEGSHGADGTFDSIVWAKELDPAERYEITLKSNDGNYGVIFGPQANVKVNLGNMVGETVFAPNEKGELFVSMVNPERIISIGQDFRIILKTKDGKEIVRTAPFNLSNE